MSVCCDNLRSAVTADDLMEGHYCSVNTTHTSVVALTGLPCAAAHPSMNKNKRLNVSEELPQSKPAVSASLVSMSYLLVLSVLIGLQANMKLMLYVFSFWRANKQQWVACKLLQLPVCKLPAMRRRVSYLGGLGGLSVASRTAVL